MLRKLLSALKAAITTILRMLERGWDGVWRVVMSPLRALLGSAAPEPQDLSDIAFEQRVDALIENERSLEPTLSPAQAAARHAAVEAEAQLEADLAEPQPEPVEERWIVARAREWMDHRERQRDRGLRVLAAMKQGDLARLSEEERAVLERLDEHDWNEVLDLRDGVKVAEWLDEEVRGYAQSHALHERLEREGKLDQTPAPALRM